ncbi:MAG TPA: hypothetical protein VHZ28_16800 [Terracidiphilus sp.]|jgi:hypothetical protein|nr:hypothetical protein [Terracidiphilus sp.]
MRILRAFGEQIGIFTSPKDSKDKKPTLVRSEPANPQPAIPQEEPPALIDFEVPHCCFYCTWCSAQILLPHDSLGFAFGGPMIRKIEARSIGTVCASCGKVGTYSLFRGCHGYDTRHRFVPAFLHGRTVLLDWLACDAESCVFKLPFFVTYDEDLTEANVKEWAPKWLWDNLSCSVGHNVAPPKWIFEMRPHRAALDLTRAGIQRRR